MDPTQLGPHLTPILTISILVSLLKPFIEQTCPPVAPLHDALIRLLAITLGLTGMVLHYSLHTQHISGPGIENALGSGLLAGVGAILTYHLVSGSLFPTTKPT